MAATIAAKKSTHDSICSISRSIFPRITEESHCFVTSNFPLGWETALIYSTPSGPHFCIFFFFYPASSLFLLFMNSEGFFVRLFSLHWSDGLCSTRKCRQLRMEQGSGQLLNTQLLHAPWSSACFRAFSYKWETEVRPGSSTFTMKYEFDLSTAEYRPYC